MTKGGTPGAVAVVTKDVAPSTVVGGVPAKLVSDEALSGVKGRCIVVLFRVVETLMLSITFPK